MSVSQCKDKKRKKSKEKKKKTNISKIRTMKNKIEIRKTTATKKKRKKEEHNLFLASYLFQPLFVSSYEGLRNLTWIHELDHRPTTVINPINKSQIFIINYKSTKENSKRLFLSILSIFYLSITFNVPYNNIPSSISHTCISLTGLYTT